MTSKAGEFINPKDTLIAAETAKNVASNVTPGQEKLIKSFGNIGTIANVLTGVGTVADIANNVLDNREARKMKEQQERNQKDKMKRETKKRKRHHRKSSAHPLSTTGVVQEMFNQSTGHTSYGASRLPGRR